jgi:hypothetical protein
MMRMARRAGLRRTLPVLAIFLLAVAAIYASPFSAQPPLERAHSGDGDLDAPVPAVGEPGGPSRTLDAAEMEQWLRGRAVFDRDFHRSDGCGSPDMNADSCRACHQDPALGGAGGLELNVSRFAHDNGGSGPYMDMPGGQGLSKLRPPFAAEREEYDAMVADVFEQRQTPSLFGGGLIDAISEADILANEDPTDLDADGVRGIARILDVGSGPEVGRFGWKAQAPRLADFARDAFANECGITTPDDGRGFALVTDADPVSDPELSQQDLDDLIFFLKHLAPPKPGESADPRRAAGEILFDTIGCAKCHIPSLGGVPLFSDLLLHNVMPIGYRGMQEPGAGAGVFRTPPLWGNCRTAPYLHDGRAETVEAAILSHFGEASNARLGYIALTPVEKDQLLFFLGDI